VVRQERWSYSTWFGKCSIHEAYFQLYDVLRFNSTVVINVLVNTSSPKLNNQFSYNFETWSASIGLFTWRFK